MARKTKDSSSPSFFYLVFLFIIIMTAFYYIYVTLSLILLWLFIVILIKWHKWKKLHSYNISNIDDMEGIEFEEYVAKLLKNEGYSKIEVTKGSGDFGVDVLCFLDDESYAIQVKRYEKHVSRTAVSDAISGKDFYECDRAMVITNSYFTKGAKEMAESLDCKLVDKDILIDWIYRFNKNERKSNNG